jgi:uncharacterized protein YgiB involved in biofilm formation
MKRSRSIELALMGAVPLLLAGCDDSDSRGQTALLYEDLQSCIADGQVSADVCQKGYEQALDAEKSGPRFSSLAACEDEYGYSRCHPMYEGGSSWFIPAAAGFLIARAMDSNRYYRHDYYGWSGYGGGWSGYSGWTAQPMYRPRGDRGEWRTASGDRFGWGARGPGADSAANTLSRGGFGRTAAARGSWGG